MKESSSICYMTSKLAFWWPKSFSIVSPVLPVAHPLSWILPSWPLVPFGVSLPRLRSSYTHSPHVCFFLSFFWCSHFITCKSGQGVCRALRWLLSQCPAILASCSPPSTKQRFTWGWHSWMPRPKCPSSLRLQADVQLLSVPAQRCLPSEAFSDQPRLAGSAARPPPLPSLLCFSVVLITVEQTMAHTVYLFLPVCLY